MPAESTASVLVLAAAAAATSFFAGATVAPTVQEVKQVAQIAQSAQEVAKLSEASVFWFSLGGGVGGAFVAISFGLYRGSSQQLAMRFVGSATLACLCTPAFMLWRDFPLTMSYIMPVSGAFGLLAYGMVMAGAPIAFEWFPRWWRKKLGIVDPSAATEKMNP